MFLALSRGRLGEYKKTDLQWAASLGTPPPPTSLTHCSKPPCHPAGVHLLNNPSRADSQGLPCLAEGHSGETRPKSHQERMQRIGVKGSTHSNRDPKLKRPKAQEAWLSLKDLQPRPPCRAGLGLLFLVSEHSEHVPGSWLHGGWSSNQVLVQLPEAQDQSFSTLPRPAGC